MLTRNYNVAITGQSSIHTITLLSNSRAYCTKIGMTKKI